MVTQVVAVHGGPNVPRHPSTAATRHRSSAAPRLFRVCALSFAAFVTHRACAAFMAGWGITSSSPTPKRTLLQAEPTGAKVLPRAIADFTVGEVVEGRVAFRQDSGAVFVDIGSFGNALLIAPNRLRSKLKPDELLKDLSVDVADQEGKRLVVKFLNPEKALEERIEPEAAASGGDEAVAADGQDEAQGRRRRPIADFSVGDVVEGRVAAKVSGLGVLLDVGAMKPALLIAPYMQASRLRPRSVLKGLRVKEVDVERKRLAVSLPDGEVSSEPAERTERKAAKKARKPLSEFSVGDIVEGRVAAKTSDVGVFVDIGAEKLALVSASHNRGRKLQERKVLRGLRVKEVDLERRRLAVTLPEEEEAARKPVSEFCVGDVVDGRVVVKQRDLGVMLDIGATRHARLDAPYKLGMKLPPQKILRGLTVSEVDLERGRLSVTLPFMLRKPLSEFSAGDVIDGRVVFKKIGVGAFVQIGAEKSALLLAPYEQAMKLRLNETLPGLRVKKVELERERILVFFPDLEALVAGRDPAPPLASGTAPIPSRAGGAADEAPQAPPPQLAEERKALAEYSVGDVVDGRVAGKKAGVGVFVDVGAERTALLIGPYSLAMRLKPNSTLQGLVLQEVDLKRGRLAVTLPSGLEARYKPISDFRVGDVIDGEVAVRKGGVGVFVDVGAVQNAALRGPTAMALKLRPKEALKGLRVEKVDVERNLLRVTYPDLERHVDGRQRL